jgi:hypothetical protein
MTERATIPGKPILSYFRRLFVAADQFVNVLFGGDEDETVSSRVAKDRDRGRIVGCVLCRFLDLFDPNHCDKALERDEGKRPGQYDRPNRI